MQEVVAKLNEKGWAAQLRHVPEETTFQEHGFVRLIDEATKEVLVESKDLQHNRNFRRRATMACELLEKFPTAPVPTKKAEEAVEDEASTKAASSDAEGASAKASPAASDDDEEPSALGKGPKTVAA